MCCIRDLNEKSASFWMNEFVIVSIDDLKRCLLGFVFILSLSIFKKHSEVLAEKKVAS